METTSIYEFDKHWYLGFLGIIGFYEFHQVIAFFNGHASFWALTSLLWFLWFLYFIPNKKRATSKELNA